MACYTGDVIRALFVGSLLMVACGGSSPAPEQPVSPVVADKAPLSDPTCPLLVAGTSVTVEDADGATALVFVTTGDVAAVREAGGALATMHNDRGGPTDALGMMFSADSSAAASEIPGGVRVVFTATDAAKAAAVGDELRMHAGHLAGATSCAM